MPSYAFRGNNALIEGIEPRMSEAGFSRDDNLDAADYLITYCTNLTELEDLYFGDGGLAQASTSRNITIDMSPCTPNLASEISGVCAISDIKFVSAPLNVINKVAADALVRENLSCYAGGEGEVVKEALPLLDVIFGSVQEVKDAAAAQLIHAAQAIFATCRMVSIIESLSLTQAGKDSVAPVDISGAMTESELSPRTKELISAIRNGQFDSNYTVEMVLGELSAAMMSADDYEMILPQTESAFHLFELLAVIGGASLSPAALSLVYEGDQTKDAHGLDWSRAEALYGGSIADDAVDDYDAEEMDMDGDDIFGGNFGYSIN